MGRCGRIACSKASLLPERAWVSSSVSLPWSMSISPGGMRPGSPQAELAQQLLDRHFALLNQPDRPAAGVLDFFRVVDAEQRADGRQEVLHGDRSIRHRGGNLVRL